MFIDLRNKYLKTNHKKFIGSGVSLKQTVKAAPIHHMVRDMKEGVVSVSNIVGGNYNNKIPIIQKAIKPKNFEKGGSVLNFDKIDLTPKMSSTLSDVRIPIIGKKKIRNSLKISI